MRRCGKQCRSHSDAAASDLDLQFCSGLSVRIFKAILWPNVSFDGTPSVKNPNKNDLVINTLNYNTPPLSCRGQITLSNIDEICLIHINACTKFG